MRTAHPMLLFITTCTLSALLGLFFTGYNYRVGAVVGTLNITGGSSVAAKLTSAFSVYPTQYSTGTAVQGTAPSTANSTITGTGTTFTAAMVGSQFTFADGTSAGTITAYNSATSLTVSTSQYVASQAYYIGYTGLYVGSTGLVGMGTTSPATKLDIDTASNTLGLRLRGAAETTEIADIYVRASGALKLSTENTGASNEAYIEMDPEDDQYGFILRDSNTGSTIFSNLYMNDAATDYLNINVNTTNATTGLAIDANQNVGIGTPNPTQKLTVAGAIIGQSAAGSGDVLYVGNDTKIVDVDVANTIGIYSQGAPTEGGLLLGSAAPAIYGKSGNIGIGDLTPTTKLEVAGEVTSSSANSFRTVQGNYGSFTRNDGSDTYILLTASADPYGPWNTLRPFRINNASGDVYMAMGAATGMFVQHSTGNVGIGTTAPSRDISLQNSDTNTYVAFQNTNAEKWVLGSEGTISDRFVLFNNSMGNYPIVVLNTSGNVGIGGVTAPASKLAIGGVGNAAYTIYATGGSSASLFGETSGVGSGVYGYSTSTGTAVIGNNISGSGSSGYGVYGSSTYRAIYGNGPSGGTGTWNNWSDLRVKKDITTISNAMDKVLKLRGVNFQFRTDEFPDKNFEKGRKMGFIAQEVEPIVPEVVQIDSDGYYSISQGPLTALLVNAMQEQQAQIEDLKTRLDSQQSQIDELKDLLKSK